MKLDSEIEGDILLQLSQSTIGGVSEDQSQDEDPRKQVLTVSSRILCLASPVFNAMLRSSFKEAVDLADRKATSMPYSLDLPEDDAEAMTVFCKVIHFDSDDLTETPAAAFLEKLAYICDKYQCTGPMKYCGAVWVRNWFQNHDEKTTSIDDLCQILVFAYVLDLPNEFTEAAWRLFLYHKGPFTGARTQVRKLEGHPLLPDSIVEALNAIRFTHCKSYHQALMHPLNQNWSTLAAPCHTAAKAVGSYLVSLHKAALLPHDLEFTEHRFCDVLRKASDLPTITEQTYCTKQWCTCKSDRVQKLPEKLQQGVESIKKHQMTFICIDCLKTKGESKKASACRVFHA